MSIAETTEAAKAKAAASAISTEEVLCIIALM
jgi:hypothetical protein